MHLACVHNPCPSLLCMSLLAHFRLEQGIPAAATNSDEGPSDRQNGDLSRSSSGFSLFGSPSRDSPPSPGQGGQRRRTDSLFQDLDEQRKTKRMKQYALDTCRENLLEDDALEQFAEVSNVVLTVLNRSQMIFFSWMWKKCLSLCTESSWPLSVHGRKMKPMSLSIPTSSRYANHVTHTKNPILIRFVGNNERSFTILLVVTKLNRLSGGTPRKPLGMYRLRNQYPTCHNLRVHLLIYKLVFHEKEYHRIQDPWSSS